MGSRALLDAVRRAQVQSRNRTHRVKVAECLGDAARLNEMKVERVIARCRIDDISESVF